jgi:hypothetical protein
MGEICLDGSLDIGDGVYAIQYIKVTDRSPMASFPNSADAYDLDGILVLNENCPSSNAPIGGGNSGGSQRITAFDNNNVPDEIAEIEISPNPFRESFKLGYETGSVNESVTIRLFNYVGQMVHQESLSVPKNTKYSHEINGAKLPRGVYIVSVESAGQKQSMKIIKN